jgi:lipopolysaccharide biosynthesis glycosyltransferase
MKKNRAVVFTLSSNLTFAVACVMMDIKRLSPNLADEIVIIHDGISKKDQVLLSSILPSCFILYDFPIKDTSIFNQETLSYFTKMVFAKYECLKLLNDYKSVLFLDYDQIIMDDISELLVPVNSGAKMLESDGKIKNQLHEPIRGIDMEQDAYCGAIMAFFDSIGDYNKMHKWCYNKTAEYAKYLYAPEQAIFAMMFKEFGIVPVTVNIQVYCCHPSNAEMAEKAKIIHAYGQPKFWNGIKNERWEKNYQLWLKMGGSRYNNKSFKRLFRIKINKVMSLYKKHLDFLKH